MALSSDGGQSWSEAITPHTDGTLTEHGFVSLFPWQSGVGALWLDGRNMAEDGHGTHGDGESAEGMTLRSAVIAADRDITESQLVDDLVCDCCQTDVAIAASGPIAVYRNRTSDEIRDIHVSRAIDGRWHTGQAVADDGWEIAGCPVNGPAIAARDEDVAIAWFTAAKNTPLVRFVRSRDSAASFSAPIDIELARPVGRVDIELLSNGDAVVSWLRSSDDGQGEFCVRKVSTTGELGPVRVIAHTSTARMSGFPQMIHRDGELVFAWTDTSSDVSVIHTAVVEDVLQSL